MFLGYSARAKRTFWKDKLRLLCNRTFVDICVFFQPYTDTSETFRWSIEAISYCNKISILKVYTHGKGDEARLPEAMIPVVGKNRKPNELSCPFE